MQDLQENTLPSEVKLYSEIFKSSRLSLADAMAMWKSLILTYRRAADPLWHDICGIPMRWVCDTDASLVSFSCLNWCTRWVDESELASHKPRCHLLAMIQQKTPHRHGNTHFGQGAHHGSARCNYRTGHTHGSSTLKSSRPQHNSFHPRSQLNLTGEVEEWGRKGNKGPGSG